MSSALGKKSPPRSQLWALLPLVAVVVEIARCSELAVSSELTGASTKPVLLAGSDGTGAGSASGTPSKALRPVGSGVTR